LVAAVQAAGLVDVLSGTGPFTVFAPTNDAFENLPAGTVDKLLKKENKAMLTSVLTYHVLSGNYTSEDLMKLIKKGNGTAKLPTVQGDVLMFTANGNRNIMVTDQQGNKANISIYDVYQSNGVIFVIDQVLMPAK
jgi:uncharacterized surface protein with fasciclin (FAS1) repeats